MRVSRWVGPRGLADGGGACATRRRESETKSSTRRRPVPPGGRTLDGAFGQSTSAVRALSTNPSDRRTSQRHREMHPATGTDSARAVAERWQDAAPRARAHGAAFGARAGALPLEHRHCVARKVVDGLAGHQAPFFLTGVAWAESRQHPDQIAVTRVDDCGTAENR